MGRGHPTDFIWLFFTQKWLFFCAALVSAARLVGWRVAVARDPLLAPPRWSASFCCQERKAKGNERESGVNTGLKIEIDHQNPPRVSYAWRSGSGCWARAWGKPSESERAGPIMELQPHKRFPFFCSRGLLKKEGIRVP